MYVLIKASAKTESNMEEKITASDLLYQLFSLDLIKKIALTEKQEQMCQDIVKEINEKNVSLQTAVDCRVALKNHLWDSETSEKTKELMKTTSALKSIFEKFNLFLDSLDARQQKALETIQNHVFPYLNTTKEAETFHIKKTNFSLEEWTPQKVEDLLNTAFDIAFLMHLLTKLELPFFREKTIHSFSMPNFFLRVRIPDREKEVTKGVDDLLLEIYDLLLQFRLQSNVMPKIQKFQQIVAKFLEILKQESVKQILLWFEKNANIYPAKRILPRFRFNTFDHMADSQTRNSWSMEFILEHTKYCQVLLDQYLLSLQSKEKPQITIYTHTLIAYLAEMADLLKILASGKVANLGANFKEERPFSDMESKLRNGKYDVQFNSEVAGPIRHETVYYLKK